MYDLGTIAATIGIDTSPLEAGAGAISGIVDQIVGSLTRIGEIALGVALGEQVNGVVQQLERLPRTLTDIQGDLEIFSVTMGTLFQQTGEQAKNLLNADEIEKQVQDATSVAQTAVDRALENMSNATANHERDVGTSWSRIAEHYQDAARATALATQQMADHTEDFTTRSARSLEDLNTKLANIGANDRNPFEGLAEAFDETMLRISQSFDRHMRDLSATHADRLATLGDQAAKVASTMDEKIADAGEKAAQATKDAIAQHAIAIDNIFHSVERENENFAANMETRNQKLGNSIRDAGEQHVEAMKGYAARAAEVVEKVIDAVSRVNDRLAEQMGALRARQLDETVRFSEQMQKISEDAAASQEKNAENLQKIMDLQTSRVNALADSAASHSDRLESINQQESNAEARDALRLRQLDREAKTLAPGDTKGAARLEEERTRIREEAELRKTEQDQAVADENKRYETEQQKLQERYAKEMAALQTKAAQEKEAADKKEQQATIAAVKEHARNDAALQDSIAKAQHQAAIEIQRIQITEGYQLASINRQQEAEDLRFAITMRRVKEQYEMEVATANRTHQQKLDDLARALDAEDARYAAQLAKIKRDEEEKTKKAKEEADKREQEIAKQVEREDAKFDRQRKEAESKRVEDEGAADRRLQRQLAKADEVANRQIAAADRQTAAANRAFERQQEDSSTRYDRQVRDNEEAQDKIEARRDRAVEHELQSQQKTEDSYEQHLTKLQAKVEELQKKLETAQENARDGIEASQRLAQTEFTDAWYERANQLEDVFDKLQGHAEESFRWKVPPENATEAEKYKHQIDQVQEYLLEFDRRSVSDLDTIQKSYFTLRAAGVDPVTMSLDKLNGGAKGANISLLGIATTLESLPQGHNQIEMIDRALISLANGSILNVQRELGRFGIRLDQISTEVDGKTVKILNQNHQLNSALGVTAEMATQAVLYHISQMTDEIQQNLIGTYAQITSSFKTMRIIFERDAGGAFFGGLKDQLRDLSEYLNTSKVKGQVKEIATTIGTEIGGMITAIATAFRHLDDLADDPTYRLIDYVGNIFASLGRLKDSIIAVLGDIWNAFFPTMLAGKSPSDVLAGIGDTIDGVANAVRDAGPSIAAFTKSFAEGLMMAGKWIVDNKDDIIKAAQGVFNSFVEAGKWLVDNGPSVGDTLAGIDKILRGLIKFIDDHPDAIRNVVLGFVALSAISGVVGVISGIGTAISGLFGHVDRLVSILTGRGGAAGGGAGGTGLGSAIKAMGDVAGVVTGTISGLASAIAGAVVQAGRLVGILPKIPPPPVVPWVPSGTPFQIPMFPLTNNQLALPNVPPLPPPTAGGSPATPSGASAAASAAAQEAKQLLEQVQGNVRTTFDALRTNSKDVSRAVVADLEPIGPAFERFIGSPGRQAFRQLQGDGRTIISALSESFQDIGRAAVQGFSQALAAARNFGSYLASGGLLKSWLDLEEAIRRLPINLGGTLTALRASIQSAFASFFAIEGPTDRLADAMGRAFINIIRGLWNLDNVAADVWSRVTGSRVIADLNILSRQAAATFESAASALQNMVSRIDYGIEGMVQRAVAGLRNIPAGAVQAFEGVVGAANGAIDRVISAFGRLAVRGDTGIWNIGTQFEDIINRVMATIESNSNRATALWRQIAGSGAVTTFRETEASATTLLRNIRSGAGDLFLQLGIIYDRIRLAGASGLFQGIEAGFDSIRGQLSGLMTPITNFLNGIRNMAPALAGIGAAIAGAGEAIAGFLASIALIPVATAIAVGAAIGLSVAWAFDIGNTRQNLELFLAWLKAQLPEGIRSAIDSAKETIAGWAAPFGQMVENAKRDLNNLTSAFREWVIGTLPEPLRGIGPVLIDAIGAAVTAALPEWMRNLKRIAGSGLVSEWTDTILPNVLRVGLTTAFSASIGPAGLVLLEGFRRLFAQVNSDADRGMADLKGRLSGDASKTTASMYQEFDELVPKLDAIWARLHTASVEELSATQGDLQAIFIRLRYESGTEAETLRNVVVAKIAALAAEMKERSGEGTGAVSANFAAMEDNVGKTTANMATKVSSGAVTLSDTLNKMAADADSVSVPRMAGALHQLRVAFSLLEDSSEDGAEEMRATITEKINLLAGAIAKKTGDMNVDTSTNFKAGADAGIGEATRLNTSVSTLMAAMAASATGSTADASNSMRNMASTMEESASTADRMASALEAAAARAAEAGASMRALGETMGAAPGSAPMPSPASATNPGISAALTGVGGGGGGFGRGANSFGALGFADAMPPDYSTVTGNASSFANSFVGPNSSGSGGNFASISDTMPMGNSSFGGQGSGASGGSTGGIVGNTKLEISSLIKDMGEAMTASPAFARILGTAGSSATYAPTGESSIGDIDRYIGSSLAAWANTVGSMGRQNMSEFGDSARQLPPTPNVGPLAVPTKSTSESTGPTSGGGGGGAPPPQPPKPKEPDPGGKPPTKPEEPPLPRDEPDRNVTINNQFGTFTVNGSSPEFLDRFVSHEIELFNAASVSAAT